MSQSLTDAELRLVAEYVARRYLEVERGLRDKRCLRRFLSPAAYAQQHTPGVSYFTDGGPVRQTDLGAMVFQRPTPDRVFVTVPARQHHDQWGALVMELRADPKGTWRVTELSRAQDRNLVHPPPLRPLGREDARVALARLDVDLHAARLARAAAANRHDRAQRLLDRLATDRPASQVRPGDRIDSHPPDQRWTSVDTVTHEPATGQVSIHTAGDAVLHVSADQPVTVLDRAADTDTTTERLRAARQQLVDAAAEMPRWDDTITHLETQHAAITDRALAIAWTAGGPEPPDYLVRLLGEPPTDPAARQVWDAAAEAVDAYRERWDLTATDSALGPRPSRDTRQHTDRAATVATLRDLRAQLHDLLQASQRHEAGRTPEREITGHDPFAIAVPRHR